MGRLTALKPTLGRLAPRLGYAAGDEKARDKQRYQQQHYRAWYNSAQWKALRLRVFIRDLFTCQLCQRLEGNTSKLIGDHKAPHRGDRSLFFDEQNVWTLCKPCHDGVKQREEKRHAR